MPSSRPDADRRIRQADRLARILRVSRLVDSPGRLNADQIAGELDVSRRNVLRDIKTLIATGVSRYHIHTSGHATIADLRRLVQAFPDSRIVPIHLDNPKGFAKLADNVDLKNDQQWWEV